MIICKRTGWMIVFIVSLLCIANASSRKLTVVGELL